MKKIRTEQFFKTLYTSMGIGSVFLLFMLFFGRSIATSNFDVLLGCVFTILGLAVLSFLIFSFLPYFHGDRRWLAIPTLFAAVFMIGTAMLWQFPIGGI